MKKFGGYDEASKAARFVGGERLPAGAYVCKVMNVKFEEGTDGKSDMIKMQYDIIEGDYKDFFRKQYDANTNEDKKWKGSVTIWCPTDDGSEKDGWTKNAFASWTNALEDSNPGYKWDWDESKWKGKILGIHFGETGTVIDGREIVYTEPRRGISVEDVRSGNFKELKFKAKNGYTGNQDTTTSTNDFVNIPEGAEEEIPF